MMGYTPGPWKWWDESTGRPKKYDCAKLLGKDGRTIINKYGKAGDLSLGTSEEDVANARLIAAAPKLLAACKLTAQWLRNFVEAEGPSDQVAVLQRIVDAAIAEAEGGE